jgi:hypothetical protein
MRHFLLKLLSGSEGGLLSRVGDHFLPDFYTLYVSRTKLLTHPRTKPRRGGGPQTDKQQQQRPFAGYF